MKIRDSGYRKVRKTKPEYPETPGSRIYWNAYILFDEYCKERTLKNRRHKPFFRFIIDEIDLALKEINKNNDLLIAAHVKSTAALLNRVSEQDSVNPKKDEPNHAQPLGVAIPT